MFCQTMLWIFERSWQSQVSQITTEVCSAWCFAFVPSFSATSRNSSIQALHSSSFLPGINNVFWFNAKCKSQVSLIRVEALLTPMSPARQVRLSAHWEQLIVPPRSSQILLANDSVKKNQQSIECETADVSMWSQICFICSSWTR